MISGEATKQNGEKRSVLPYCHRKASFKQPIWYKKTPIGKNTITTIRKKLKENSPLKDLCPEKNLTNHSARKTVVKKLKSPGIPKCEIKNITETITTQGTNESN